jgi:hypothetical protein
MAEHRTTLTPTVETPEEFRAALDELGWSYHEAAVHLRVGGGANRVGDWVRGDRPLPGYIAASVKAHLELARLWAYVRQLRGGL